jgi:hypothetical protein
MGESAGLLVDHRLPHVPYRQWVLSFPGPLAIRLGYDTELLAAVARSFSKRVMQQLRRRVQCEHGLRRRADLHAGVLVVVQRFRSDLGLFVHLHCLVTDGCFLPSGHGAPRFLAAGSPENEDLVEVLGKVHGDLEERLGDVAEEPDAGIVACVELGSRERQLALVGATGESGARKTKPLTVAGFGMLGMQLHAATTVDGADRAALERVCRYLLRPPFAQDAIEAREAAGGLRRTREQGSSGGGSGSDSS